MYVYTFHTVARTVPSYSMKSVELIHPYNPNIETDTGRLTMSQIMYWHWCEHLGNKSGKNIMPLFKVRITESFANLYQQKMRTCAITNAKKETTDFLTEPDVKLLSTATDFPRQLPLLTGNPNVRFNEEGDSSSLR